MYNTSDFSSIHQNSTIVDECIKRVQSVEVEHNHDRLEMNSKFMLVNDLLRDLTSHTKSLQHGQEQH
jgi:hypothetical protein